MAKAVYKKFNWVIKEFSLQSKKCYSVPVLISDCKWRLVAFHKGINGDYLSLYLDATDSESLPCGWRRYVKLKLTLVNQLSPKLSVVKEGQRWFDASSNNGGFEDFIPLLKLRSRDEGFLVDDKLIIVAQLHVSTEETVDLIECQEGNQAADASSRNSQEDSTCQEVKNSENAASQEKVDYDVSQNISCVDASKEDLDVDGASEEGSDDDGPKEGKIDDDDSSLVAEDGSMLEGPLNQSNSMKDGSSLTVGNCGMRCNNVVSETGVSTVDYDDAAKDAVIENEQGDGNASSQRVEDIGDMKCNKVASVTEASNDILKEVQPIKETKDVNGFQVLSSQVELVSHIFKRHPDIALGFRPKNKEIRRAYMNELLSLIDMLCQSPEKLSEDDLSNADDTLADLIDVGFKLDWLKIKLNEVSEKKKKEKGSGARLQTMEEQLQKLKLMFVDLETQVQMEKAEASAARATLSFNDVV